mgnify:CR=1 FL=1
MSTSGGRAGLGRVDVGVGATHAAPPHLLQATQAAWTLPQPRPAQLSAPLPHPVIPTCPPASASRVQRAGTFLRLPLRPQRPLPSPRRSFCRPQPELVSFLLPLYRHTSHTPPSQTPPSAPRYQALLFHAPPSLCRPCAAAVTATSPPPPRPTPLPPPPPAVARESLTLIPVQAQPLEVADHGLLRGAGGAGRVRVLHTGREARGEEVGRAGGTGDRLGRRGGGSGGTRGGAGRGEHGTRRADRARQPRDVPGAKEGRPSACVDTHTHTHVAWRMPTQCLPLLPHLAPWGVKVDALRAQRAYRRMNLPPILRAYSQLKRAVRAPPTCRLPVGEGAKRTRTYNSMRARTA